MAPVVVLIGLPAAGKTSAGRRLARRLGVPFADSDLLVQAVAGKPVPEIFATAGETTFRELEAAAIAEALAEFDGVLALGGGAVMRPDTEQLLQESGVLVVHLVTTVTFAARLVRGGRGRPLLAGDPTRRLAELEAQRAPVYERVATASVRSHGRPMVHVVEDLYRLVSAQRPTDAATRGTA